MRNRLLALALVIIAVAIPLHRAAAEPQPGDVCTTADTFIRVGGPENAGSGHFLVCDGSVWQPVLRYFPDGDVLFNSSGSAAAPLHVYGEAIIWESGLPCSAAAEGAVRYLSATTPPWEYCDGSAWLPFKQPRCVDDDTGECYLAVPRSGDDPDFIAGNIADGVNVLGVTGTLTSGSDPNCVDDSSVQCILAAPRSTSDPQFIADNILSGTNVLGVTGTAEAFCTKRTCASVIEAGTHHSCAIRLDGTAWCWGRALNGRLGDGQTTTDRFTPVPVSGGGTWIDISAGSTHSCGIKSDGTAWCWGSDTSGQLGDDVTLADQSTPVQVADAGPWTSISAGGSFSCGLKDNGTVWCWGNKSYVGDGQNTTDRPTPVQIADAGPWKMLSSNLIHSCALKSDDTAWCWGPGSSGQLGNGSTAAQPAPVAVSGGRTYTYIVAGVRARSCAIEADGTAWCWGFNGNGELACCSSTSQSTPQEFLVGTPMKAIAPGASVSGPGFTKYIKMDNSLANNGGSGSSGSSRFTPGPWKSISPGGYANQDGHYCGIYDGFVATCWGENQYGQIGVANEMPVTFKYPDEPYSFIFTDLTEGLLSVLVSSDIVLINGLSVSVNVDISGQGSPEFRICSASDCSTVVQTWGSTTQTINDGEYLQLRMTTSGSLSTTLIATVTVGQGSDNWSTTTVTVLPKVVFLTSTTYKGNGIALATADAACGTHATSGGFGGTFKAWVSDTANSTASRFTNPTTNYALPDGTIIANGWADLIDGSIDNAINLDESNTPTSATYVWTGTTSAGASAAENCSDWGSGGGGAGPGSGGEAGDIGSTSSTWTDGTNHKCGSSLPIMCFEQ